jgi:putative ABC transport system permease protein
MRRLQSCLRRLKALATRRRLDDELREEIEAHIEARRQALVADGMDERDALHAARRQFGNVTAIAERTREAREFPTVESILQDVRYGTRLLWRAPLFTLVAVLSIALGLSAGVAIFTLANAAILRPVAGAGRDLHRVYIANRGGSRFGGSSYPDFLDFSRARSFSAMCGTARVRANITIGGTSTIQSGAIFTDRCFELLGVPALHGRLLGRGAEPEVVISYSLWRQRFGGDSAAVGTHVLVNGAPATVVGVTAASFSGTSLDGSAEFWVAPAPFTALLPPRALEDRGHRVFTIFARLREGVTAGQAEAEIAGIGAGLRQSDPAVWGDDQGGVRRVTVMRELDSRFADAGDTPSMLLLEAVAAVVVIVSIASVNIATMLLARGAARTRELTIRLALGASRGRLLRQLATESLLIALLGMAIALGAVAAGIRAVAAWRPAGLPAVPLAIDWRVTIFAVLIALFATVLCGLLPGMHVVRLAIADGMKGRVAGVRALWMRGGVREALIVIQVTVSVAALIVSTLFARGLAAGAAAAPGFTTTGVTSIGVDLALANRGPAAELADRILDAVASQPNVESPAIGAVLPLTGSSMVVEVKDDSGAERVVEANVVSAGYLKTMGIALGRGRDFTGRDRAGNQPVAIASETFARTFWRTDDAIGRSLVVAGQTVQIVGVAADTRYRSVTEPYRPVVYLPFAQRPRERFVIYVRVRGGGETLAALDAASRSIDPRIMIDGVMPLDRRLETARAPERATGWIGAAAGLVQFWLALMALWALVAFAVQRRTQEIGVRLALGASPARLVRMMIRPAVLLIGTGSVLGTGIGLAVAVGLHSEFVGLAALEPAAGVPTVAAMIVIGLVAALIPAHRAARVDPMTALRAD